MRLLWTMLKIVVVAALAIPLAIIALGMLLGVFGALIGLAFVALRLAIVGVVIWLVFLAAKALFGGSRKTSLPRLEELEPVDPYYEAARRELDQELGGR